MEKELPFVSFSNEELENNAEIGEEVLCKNCGKYHKVEYGDKILEDGTKVPSKLLAFIKCDKDETIYLVGIKGKLLK